MNKSVTLNPIHVIAVGGSLALAGVVIPGFMPLVFFGLAIALAGVVGWIFTALTTKITKDKGGGAIEAKYLLLAAGLCYLVSFILDGIIGALFGTVGLLLLFIGLYMGVVESLEARRKR